MARRSAAETLPLALPMTRELAYELTSTIPITTTFVSYTIKQAGGRRVGPYYRASFRRNGRLFTVHVGNEDRKRELLAAHALVRAELEAEAAAVDPRVGDMLDRQSRLYGDDSTAARTLKRTAPVRVSSAPGARLETTEAAKLREVTR
jgi:hypothetical protein